MDRVAIIGAGLAGVRTADALRRRGFGQEIVLCGDELDPPYDRPPLSKSALVDTDLDLTSLALVKPDILPTLGWRPGAQASALEASTRTVAFRDGSSLSADAIVVATGSRARELPTLTRGLRGVHGLRSLADLRALRSAAHQRAATTTGRRCAVVIGAGFIGAETASSLIRLGWHVDIVEPQPAPLARGLGLEVGGACAQLMRNGGARVHLDTGVEALLDDGAGHVRAALLSNGAELAADLVIVGVGSVPNDDWLVGSGLEVANGVVCDRSLWTGVEGVFAAGDIARITVDDMSWRHEHWTATVEHAEIVAHNLLTPQEHWLTHDEVPYVWSDQFGVKLQLVGRSGPDIAVVDGDLASDRWVVAYGDLGRLVGVVGCSRPRLVMQWRAKVIAALPWTEVTQGNPAASSS